MGSLYHQCAAFSITLTFLKSFFGRLDFDALEAFFSKGPSIELGGLSLGLMEVHANPLKMSTFGPSKIDHICGLTLYAGYL